MDYRTYHIAELLPAALLELVDAAGAAPARPEDRPPHPPPAPRPVLRPVGREKAAARD